MEPNAIEASLFFKKKIPFLIYDRPIFFLKKSMTDTWIRMHDVARTEGLSLPMSSPSRAWIGLAGWNP